ncbi:MAG TPA: lipocalin family protein [Ottowia sp.]|nr:lipocalin family protein [Ottowia sp.]
MQHELRVIRTGAAARPPQPRACYAAALTMRARTLALLGVGAYALYRLSQQTGLPPGVHPVTPFRLERWLGRWYEIARIDPPQDRGLTDGVVHHSLLPDGTLQIARRGFDTRLGRWRTTTARARPAHPSREAHLHLSLVWPVRTSRAVFDIDDADQHALVCGPTHDQLWLLARSPTMRAATRARLLDRARAAGFDVGRLTWVDHRRSVAVVGRGSSSTH